MPLIYLLSPELRKSLWSREVDNFGTVWRKGELDHANNPSYRSGFQLMWYSTGRVPGVTLPKTAPKIDPGRRLCQAQPDQRYLHCGSKASNLTLGQSGGDACSLFCGTDLSLLC